MKKSASVTEDFEGLPLADQLRIGLMSAIDQVRGKITLRTTVLPGPAPSLSPRKVMALRDSLGMSQGVFAHYLNVSVKSVQSWEQGTRVPKAGEARLLQVMEANPVEIKRLIETA